MNKKFKEYTDKMQSRFQELSEKEPIARGEIGKDPEKVPQQGVYVFYENDIAMYVGRSNRLKERLREHSQSRQHYSATLAIKIAKRNMPTLQNEERKPTVKQLMDNEDFKKEFEYARDKIAKMKIRCVKIEDQIEQAMFEIYAHLELDTEFNDFKTT